MNLLDWFLVVVVLAYALSGYWQGFVTGAFATAGLLLGGLLGIWLAPIALGNAEPSLLVSLGALFIVIVTASLGQAALQYAGARIRDTITWQPIRAVDAVGGAVLSAVAVLLVAWALGVAISGSRLGGVTSLVRESAVLGAGRHGAAQRRQPAAAGLRQRGGHDVLPPLPRAVRPRAHRRGQGGPAPAAHRPRRRRRRAERAQGAQHQQLRPRGRGQRLPLRRRPADDQRPRGRGRRPAGGHHRRQRGRGQGRALRPAARRGRAGLRRRRPAGPAPGPRGRASPRRGWRSSAIPRTAPTTSARPGSGRCSGSARPTSTATARCSARSTPCAAWSGPATPAARSSPPTAGWSAWCSPRR